ncbi:nicotinate-nucleotide adenylyltransferase [Paenibacillus agricola]|uniref:Probable nicotinate-nucleotide adenylyltransferase n=1 Tax=Paenibacillus agricola TaxID=2716264 RepID=A0ABX0J3M4_9BACL|nr:nicotinate-nucleotide adenylyltransferase [Paenibacillus agricola]NHN30982.1 nicotinate-nucleotide adenylyltransferase [Paenibacillus agricola]
MKVGIMGGTFDPVHIGHLVAAQHACEQANLDEVWFMPTHVPPHKVEAPKATPEQRWAMVCRAVEEHSHFRPFDMELKKGGVSYSIDTVNELLLQYPTYHFAYIIGADMVQYLPKWFKIDELVQKISFIGLQRPGYIWDMELLPEAIRKAVLPVQMPLIELSSSLIRKRLAEGKSVRYLVPDRVNEYMVVNGIYEPQAAD